MGNVLIHYSGGFLPSPVTINIMILVSFSSSADVHTTGEGAALELLAAMRFLIVAIVIMKQR